MGPIGPPRKIEKKCAFLFLIFPAHGKNLEMAPHGAKRIVPTNSDLADILGDTDFDFGNY